MVNAAKTFMRAALLTVFGVVMMAASAQAASFYTNITDLPANTVGVTVELWLENSGGLSGGGDPWIGFINYPWEVAAVGNIDITAWVGDNGSSANWSLYATEGKIYGTKGALVFPGDAGPVRVGTITIDTGDAPGELWANSSGQNVVEVDILDGSGNYLYSQVASELEAQVVPEPSTMLLLGMGLAGLATVRRRE